MKESSSWRTQAESRLHPQWWKHWNCIHIATSEIQLWGDNLSQEVTQVPAISNSPTFSDCAAHTWRTDLWFGPKSTCPSKFKWKTLSSPFSWFLSIRRLRCSVPNPSARDMCSQEWLRFFYLPSTVLIPSLSVHSFPTVDDSGRGTVC